MNTLARKQDRERGVFVDVAKRTRLKRVRLDERFVSRREIERSVILLRELLARRVRISRIRDVTPVNSVTAIASKHRGARESRNR